MSYSRYKMLRKLLNGIPTGEFTQGDLLPYSPFDSYEDCNEGNASPEVTPENPNMQYRWITSNEPWCEGTDEYKTEKQQQSSDSGKSWSDTGATRKGEFVQSYSFTCGFVAERWIEVNPSIDFICENGNKFYLQKKQISHDGIVWVDSGDTRKGPLIESQSSDCSYPQYRWVEVPNAPWCEGTDLYKTEKQQVTQDGIIWEDVTPLNTRRGAFVEHNSVTCGYEPPTVITRWIVAEDEFICQGVNKHQKQKEQISNDSGQTWSDTGNIRSGSLIESDSYDCGYVSFRWVVDPVAYICQGYDKYQKQNEEMTSDGQVWTPTGRTRTGALIEKNSYDCGYVSYRWVTVESEYVCQGYDKYTKEKEQSSTDGSVWQDTGRERAGSLIERDSSYCKEPPTPVKSDYLTFTALEDGTFKFVGKGLSYSTDGNTWKTLATNTPTPTIAAGSKIYFKGTMTPGTGSLDYGIGTFSSTGNFTASGTPMSLLFGDDFEGQTSLSGKRYAFTWLFDGRTKLTDISGLSLPATTLAEGCYREMFSGCTGLTSIPSDLLPATTLEEGCYEGMFSGCTGLTSISSDLLPATTLIYRCYQHMFYGCTGLASIPSDLLPATTLATECYNYMFSGCTGLTSIPSTLLPATTLADSCYQSMFDGCSGLASIPSDLLPATTLATECYNEMFHGCTGLTTIPSDLLSATTLANGCYRGMFWGCTGLTTIPSTLLPVTTLAQSCYHYMFQNCTGLTTIPSTLLPATELASDCYQSMFSGCTGLTSIPSDLLPATTLATWCYSYMFEDCSKITTAPNLTATTLPNWCYAYMFNGCTKLNSIRMLAINTPSFCLEQWVYGVASSGTFYKAAGKTLPTGQSGIPRGWTVVEV